MKKRGDAPSRSDIEARVETDNVSMQEKQTDLESLATDVETVRQTLESLEFGATSDAADAVAEAMESADDVTTTEFDSQDNELESIQAEAEEHEVELEERSDAGESDAELIEGAIGSIQTEFPKAEIEKARDVAVEEVEYLQQQIERAKEAREDSERVQQELQARVQGSGGT